MKQATRIQFAVGLGFDRNGEPLSLDTMNEATELAHILLCSAYGGASVHYGSGIWTEKPGDMPTIERTLYLTVDYQVEPNMSSEYPTARMARNLAALFKQRAVHISYWPITTGDIYHADDSNL